MGPRPHDFDEAVIKQSPTYLKWQALERGTKMKYACREFIKGNGDDEERLMRRIMIARRNNLRDHETLKRARAIRPGSASNVEDAVKEPKKRRTAPSQSDSQIAKEMDVSAVEATRSYRTWMQLEKGGEFIYNQKYIKGREGHEWLLKKNIWRRMRYRRENKQIVKRFKGDPDAPGVAAENEEHEPEDLSSTAAGIVDHALMSAAAGGPADADSESFQATAAAATVVESAVVESALAAADSYVKAESIAAMAVPTSSEIRVHNPLEAAASTEALDAAAKLAAALDDEEEEQVEEV